MDACRIARCQRGETLLRLELGRRCGGDLSRAGKASLGPIRHVIFSSLLNDTALGLKGRGRTCSLAAGAKRNEPVITSSERLWAVAPHVHREYITCSTNSLLRMVSIVLDFLAQPGDQIVNGSIKGRPVLTLQQMISSRDNTRCGRLPKA